MDDRDKLIIEIMALGRLIDAHTNYCVFIDYHGHVDSLNIEIAQSKERYNEKICTTEVSMKYREKYTEDETNGWLKAKRDVLRDILENHDVDTTDMNEYVESIYSYYF